MKLLHDGIKILCESNIKISACLNREEAFLLLEKYIAEIELFNPSYGLVSCKTRNELIVRHILDSLAPLDIIADAANQNIADAGSGAGLPGIPLAIALPQYNFTLIERMQRRADFLRNVIAILKLKNVTVQECDIEDAPSSSFDLITFRAFHPLTKELTKNLFFLLKTGGKLAAYKGKLEKINGEIDGEIKNIIVSKIYETPVPFLNEERHLVLITQS
jgi:16S rRNA (guanine527-N7)-methyltransferase